MWYKRLIIIIAIVLITGIVINNKIKENRYNEQVKEIDKQLETIFRPVIENTTFLINDEKYILQYNGVSLRNKHEYLENKMNSAVVKFSIYKDIVEDNNFVVKDSYCPEIKRKDINSPFYIYNTDRYNNLIDLVKEVYYQYFDMKAKEHNVLSSHSSAHGTFDYEQVEYDDSNGELIKPGIAQCEMEHSAGDLIINFSTEFMMVSNGDEIEIKIVAEQLEDDLPIN